MFFIFVSYSKINRLFIRFPFSYQSIYTINQLWKYKQNLNLRKIEIKIVDYKICITNVHTLLAKLLKTLQSLLLRSHTLHQFQLFRLCILVRDIAQPLHEYIVAGRVPYCVRYATVEHVQGHFQWCWEGAHLLGIFRRVKRQQKTTLLPSLSQFQARKVILYHIT